MTTAKTLKMVPSTPLDASDFKIDNRYQRQPKSRLASLNKIAATFDPFKFGVIHVTERMNGDWYIIDGAGRVFIYYELLFNTGKVPCIVHPACQVHTEAKLFVDLNKNRRAINPGDMFKADVTARNPECVAIQNIYNSVGMTIGRSCAADNIASVQSSFTLFRHDGTLLLRSLVTKKQVWPEYVCGGGLLEGIGLFIRAVPNMDEVGFRKVLAANLPEATMAQLKVRGSGRMPLKRYIPEWAAELWADKYNYRRKKQRADPAAIRRLAIEPKKAAEDYEDDE